MKLKAIPEEADYTDSGSSSDDGLASQSSQKMLHKEDSLQHNDQSFNQLIENSQAQIDCDFSSQSSDDSQEALSSDDTLIHFQGKAIWMGKSKSDPIVAIENEGQKDE